MALTGCMNLALSSAARRVAWLTLSIALAAAYLYGTARACLASRLAGSTQLADLQRSVRLEPGNARYHALLASHELLVEFDIPAALHQFQAATELDPYNAGYWMALAQAHLVGGNLPAQQLAIERAVQVDPTTPDVAWEAANFYLVRNEPDKALPRLRVVIENQPDSVARAVKLAWRATHDVRKVMDEALPPRSDAYLALLQQMVEAREAAASDRVWDRTYGLNQTVSPGGVFFYLQSLMDARRVPRAQQVWRQVGERTPGFQSYQWSADNLAINGGFEYDLLNGGFDWRLQPVPFVKLALDNLNFHHGRQSLSVVFETYYPAQIGLLQYIPVAPSTRYTLRAFVKAEDLESASGPRFAIDDAYTKARLGISEETVGSTPWDARSFDFTTGPDTSLVALSVVRDPADRLIRGKFWIDDVIIARKRD